MSARPFQGGGGKGGGIVRGLGGSPVTGSGSASAFQADSFKVRGAETPPLIAARFPPSNAATARTLRTDNTNADGVTAPLNVTFECIEVDRPCFVYPTDVVAAALIFHPGKQPTARYVVSAGLTIATYPEARKSTQHGLCYLSGPGSWFVGYSLQSANASNPLNVVVIDAADPGTAGIIAAEPGCQFAAPPVAPTGVPGTEGTGARTVDTGAKRLIGPNRDARCRIIQNTGVIVGAPVNRSIRVGFGIAPASNSGILIQSGASFTSQGDALFKGAIFVVLDASVAGAGNVEAICQDFQ